jgi:diguanylate cyclase (GGDEF)-like protein
MPPLDLRTIVFVTGVMGGLMALVLYSMRRTYPASIQGLREWSGGPLWIFVSTLLFGGRGTLPDFVTVVLANLALLAGTLLLLAGTVRFFNRSWPPGLLPGALLMVLPLLWWWGVYAPNYSNRLVLGNLIMAGVSIGMAALIASHDRRSFPARFTVLVLGLLATVTLGRAISAFLHPVGHDLFSNSWPQVVYLTGFSFGSLLLTIGLVLLADERLRQELHHLVSHDSLTGALSRHALFQQGQREMERARRNNKPLAALMLDLDHFKHINDSHGHLVGDRVLKDFADRVQGTLRRVDVMGRFGGEEFLVLLPEADTNQALAVAERIRASRTRDSTLPLCTVSIGLAVAQSPAGSSPNALLDTLIARADEALYRAKADGRDRTVVAETTTITS